MHLSRLSLHAFRNHRQKAYEFDTGVNVFVGPNGRGKTNLLDAIYYLCFGKSALHVQDKTLCTTGSDHFALCGDFIRDEAAVLRVSIQAQQGKRKRISVNEELCTSRAAYVGQFPAVWIAPGEMDILKEGNEKRRRFFDQLLSQLHAPYLKCLLQYHRYLKHRQAALQHPQPDTEWIRHYDSKLVPLAQQIAQHRQALIQDYLPLFQQTYATLAQTKQEQVSIAYESQALSSDFPERFRRALAQDQRVGRSTQGIHKDKFHWLMNDEPLKEYASEGQQKTFLLALKLSAYQRLKTQHQRCPLLLVDDISDTLDPERTTQLFQQLPQLGGQTFITGTNKTLLQKYAPKDTRFLDL